MNNFTNHDLGIWFFKILAALTCIIMLYLYIEYRRSLWREKKREDSLILIPAPDTVETTGTTSSLSCVGQLTQVTNMGLGLALDVGVLSKYPQLYHMENAEVILISEEIMSTQNKDKVVSIHQYTSDYETGQTFKKLPVNESFVAKIGLDPSNITDRAIGAYLYAVSTDLINIVFVTLDKEAHRRALKVGLQSELIS